jgi:PAS domain S-box-containing protein/diguanylate cyclase (GGDEF)-like protein
VEERNQNRRMDVKQGHETDDDALKVLLVDDSAADVALNERALRSLGRAFRTEAVASEAGLRAALANFKPDVVLSDFSMPGFSGQKALEIVREVTPETPFIFVSGTIGEELAIDAMQRGAVDYVLKGNLLRLKPAIERALDAAEQLRERRQMQRALAKSEERYRALVENTEDWIWETDAQGRMSYTNASVQRLIGRAPAELLGQSARRFLVEEDRQVFEESLPTLARTRRGWHAWVLRWRHADGSLRLLESSAQPLLDEAGNWAGYRGIDRDVTVRMQQAQKIEQLGRIQAVLSAHGNAVLRARHAGHLLALTCRVAVEQGHFNAAMIFRPEGNRLAPVSRFGDERVLDYVESLGSMDLSDPASDQRLPARAFHTGARVSIPDFAVSDSPLRQSMVDCGVAAQVALPIGNPPWGVLSLLSASPQAYDDDEIALLEQLTGQIDYARDFLAKSDRLEYLAYHHPVTGLPNRTAFGEAVAARLARGPQVFAMADIDRFRYYNKSRGRSFGDALLTAVGARLRASLPEDTLFAHPGDDNFLIACTSTDDMASAIARVYALLGRCCAEPFLVEGEEVLVRMHASVLLAPSQADSAEAIERGLAAVLAEARSLDQPVQPYTEEVRVRAVRRSELERDLRVAIAQDQFELFLQPKFNAATHRLIGAEALLRWRHPERGMVSPAQFIPALEDTGLVIEVGAWVRREGLRIWKEWQALGHDGLRVAVNVSARELRHSDFVAQCAALLEPHLGEHGLDIEITESMLMDDISKSVSVLQDLRALGCRVGIDDFGTGYSSLNYLSRLPADTLKIDQSFTNAIALSADTLSLVTNIIGLAHSLGLSVVAEGVEEEEQAKLLRLLRCDELQGYHLGRPMPVADFRAQFLD